jgi:hypothetical protein
MPDPQQDVSSRKFARRSAEAKAADARPWHGYLLGVIGLLAQTKGTTLPPVQFAYRLRAWPALRSARRTAGVMQALTRMELGPVSKRWFVSACRLPARDAAFLLDELVQHGYVLELELAREAAFD